MSTQSILELDQERYRQEAEKSLLQMSDAYFFKKKFLLGEGVDRDRLNHTIQSHRYLCIDNCEMTNFIADKIAGRLETEVRAHGAKNRFKEAMRLVQQYLETQDDASQAASDCCNWAEAEW